MVEGCVCTVMRGHCFTKQILTGVINQSNNVINLLSKSTAIWSIEESINSILICSEDRHDPHTGSIENTAYYSCMEDQVFIRRTNNQPDTKSIPNHNPKSYRASSKQHAIVTIAVEFVVRPAYPEKFIRDSVITPHSLYLPLSLHPGVSFHAIFSSTSQRDHPLRRIIQQTKPFTSAYRQIRNGGCTVAAVVHRSWLAVSLTTRTGAASSSLCWWFSSYAASSSLP